MNTQNYLPMNLEALFFTRWILIRGYFAITTKIIPQISTLLQLKMRRAGRIMYLLAVKLIYLIGLVIATSFLLHIAEAGAKVYIW